MHEPPADTRDVPAPRAPSGALLLAALGGLLCVSLCATGCEDKEPSGTGTGPSGSGDTAARITSARTDPSVTLDSFSADCAARKGTLEIHPHCGGANSCKGMSYDSDTKVLTEHTCKGLNTCTGFSCVEPSSS